MQAVRHQAAGDLFSQHAPDRVQIECIRKLMAKCTQSLFIGSLTAEEGAIHKRLQAGPYRVEEYGNKKYQRTDQVRIVIRHGDREDRTQSTDQQGIGCHNKNSQYEIHHSLAHPIVSAQKAEAQDDVTVRQREQDKGDKKIGIEGNGFFVSRQRIPQGRVQHPDHDRYKSDQGSEQDRPCLTFDHRRMRKERMDRECAEIKQCRNSGEEINVPPGIKVCCWILQIVQDEEGIQRQRNPDHIPKPAQIGTSVQQARFLWKTKSQIDQSAARQCRRHGPEIGEIMETVEIEEGAYHNGYRSGHHRECPPCRLCPAQAKNPPAERQEHQAQCHGNNKERDAISCRERLEHHIDAADFALRGPHLYKYRFTSLEGTERAMQITSIRNRKTINGNQLVTDLEALLIQSPILADFTRIRTVEHHGLLKESAKEGISQPRDPEKEGDNKGHNSHRLIDQDDPLCEFA